MSAAVKPEARELWGWLEHMLMHRIYARWGCLYCRLGHIHVASRQDRRRQKRLSRQTQAITIPRPRSWTRDDHDRVPRSTHG